MKRWDILIEKYQRYCQIRGISEATIKGKVQEAEKWGLWLKRKRPKPVLENITAEQIIEYIKCRTVYRSNQTTYSIISHLRGLGDFFLREGVWRNNPLKWIKGPKIDPRSKIPRRITKNHMQKIWLEAARYKDEFLRVQTLCLLMVVYNTGMRRGELERLNIKDWHRENASFKIICTKSGRERELPVTKTTWSCIENYLPLRKNLLIKKNIHDEENFFISRLGNPLHAHRISVKLRKLVKRAKVPSIRLHDFRHTCASDLLAEGVGIAEVQRILGHANIGTTYRYTHISGPERVAAMSKHPINKMLGGMYEK